MTPAELSKRYGFSRHAICRKIKEGRIKAYKFGGRWFLKERDYKIFLNEKYKRKSEILNEKNGNYTPKKCAQILECSVQRIYHHLRKGYIKSSRNGAAWLIKMEDLMEYKKMLIPEKQRTRSYQRKYKCLPYKSKPNGD